MGYEWKNKVVFITGAASGIGAMVVRHLMNEKVKHVAVLDVDTKIGTALQDELNSKYGANKVKFYTVDVTNEDKFLGAFKSVLDEQGYIDVVINNAGIMNDSLNVYKKEIDINLTALVTGTLKSLEFMSKEKGGKGGTVVNISSIAGITQAPVLPIYYATKAAVLQFSNCLGLDEYYSRTGVRILAICFGATNSALLTMNKLGSFDKVVENKLPELIAQYPMQSIESATKGLLEAYKLGESGSTWLINANKPAKDITATVTKAYGLMLALVLE